MTNNYNESSVKSNNNSDNYHNNNDNNNIDEESSDNDKNILFKRIGYICLSFFSSVTIVFVNKYLYSSFNGFSAGTMLMAFHFLTNFIISYSLRFISFQYFTNSIYWKPFQANFINIKHSILIALAMSTGIMIANLNLQYNPISVYQLSKLMVIPFIILLNYLLYKEYPSFKITISLVVMLIGLGFVFINDFSLRTGGLILAVLAVLLNSVTQVVSFYLIKNRIQSLF
jgi:solute carrier family 35 protein E3